MQPPQLTINTYNLHGTHLTAMGRCIEQKKKTKDVHGACIVLPNLTPFSFSTFLEPFFRTYGKLRRGRPYRHRQLVERPVLASRASRARGTPLSRCPEISSFARAWGDRTGRSGRGPVSISDTVRRPYQRRSPTVSLAGTNTSIPRRLIEVSAFLHAVQRRFARFSTRALETEKIRQDINFGSLRPFGSLGRHHQQ